MSHLAITTQGAIPWHLGFPLLSSLLYVTGALFIKRASDLGVDAWKSTFIANIICALAFTSVIPLGGSVPSWSLLWQPALVGFLFLLGQGISFLALQRGDVSIATPVMGIKVVLVAILTTALLEEVPSLKLWIGAGLSSLALFLLHRAGGGKHHDLGLTISLSMLAAAAFALFDVLVQKWSPAWGTGRFLPIMLGFVALFSTGLIPFFKTPLPDIPRNAWLPLGAGGVFIALQGLGIVTTVAVYGDATAVNIVYSARGLWSVMAVWLIGHWFQNREQHLPPATLRWRMAGAAVLMIAILMVLI